MKFCQLLNLQASNFILHHIDRKSEELTFMLESRCKRCRCPLCHKYSYSIHSKYQRHLQDLPCFANRTRIYLTTHKFYCHNPRCTQKIFTERFTEGVAPYKHMTNRLTKVLSALTLKLNGRSAECLCELLHINISDTTLNRLLYAQSLQDPTTIKVLGVDDWALKKRNRYGTILVDLEHHKIIDILEGRDSTTLQKWLEDHPGVQIVSRDRYTNYSNAITAALPHAIQVVDRWQLVKNLCEGLHKLVERNHQYLKYARKKEIQKLQRTSKTRLVFKQKKMAAAKRTANYHRRSHQLQQIKVLYGKKVPLRVIAMKLGISRNTVKKYLHLQEPPCRKSILQLNIALFDAYIRKRLMQSPNIELLQLYQEMKQRGYNGSRTTAYEYLYRYVNRPSRPTEPKLPDIFYLPKYPFCC